MTSLVFVILGLVVRFHNVSSQLLSLASHDYTPTRLWQLDSAHHGASANSHTIHAVLHDVSLAPGPFTALRNASLVFQATPASYVDIPNDGGTLDATTVFSWVLLIQPTSVSGEGVILEYWDGTGGIRLKHVQTQLVVEAHDTSNNLETISKNNVLAAGEWKFLTLTFMGFDKKKLKLIYADYDESGKPKDKVEVKVSDGTVLRGSSDVRLGASFDPTLPAFSGNVGCLRYYDAYIGKYQEGYALSCDPFSGIFSDTLDNLSEYTIDFVESTTVVTTTPQETTEPTTQPEETTILPTTQPEEATVLPTTQPEETTILPTTQPEETTILPTTQPEEATILPTTQPEGTTLPTTQPEETATTILPTTQPEGTTLLTTQPDETATTILPTTQPEGTTLLTTQPEGTTLLTTQPEGTTLQTTQPKITTLQTAHLEETTTAQPTQPEETAAQPTQPEQTTTAQPTQPEQTTTAQPTQPEETAAQQTQPEQTTTAQPTQPEQTTVQPTQPEETPAQQTQPAETIVSSSVQQGQSTWSTAMAPRSTEGVTEESTGTEDSATTTAAAVQASFHPVGGLGLYTPDEVCVQLVKEPGTNGFTSSSIMADIRSDSLNACAGACVLVSGCRAVAVETKVKDNHSVGRCLLGASGYGTITDSQFYLFTLDL